MVATEKFCHVDPSLVSLIIISLCFYPRCCDFTTTTVKQIAHPVVYSLIWTRLSMVATEKFCHVDLSLVSFIIISLCFPSCFCDFTTTTEKHIAHPVVCLFFDLDTFLYGRYREVLSCGPLLLLLPLLLPQRPLYRHQETLPVILANQKATDSRLILSNFFVLN